jgi:hypothetical protein
LRDQMKDPNVKYHPTQVHKMSGDNSYVNSTFMKKYPDLARKFGLSVGSRMNQIPLAIDGGITKLPQKGIEQIPNESKMELKRVPSKPVVEEKKPVVKKKKVEKKKPKVTKKKESLYDSQYMVPEQARPSTTMTRFTDPTAWAEGNYRSALNFKGRKNKKYKK